MPWQIKIHTDNKIIETSYSGVLAPKELQDAVFKTIQVGENFDHPRFLGDCFKLDGGHSLFDLYGLVEVLSKIPYVRTLKEAILLPELPDSSEKVRFWETACYNRGIRVRVFTRRDEAIDWLLEV